MAANVRLNHDLISRLRKIELNSICVKHPYLDIEPEEILPRKVRIETVRLVRETFVNFRKEKNVEVAGITRGIQNIIGEALKNQQALLHISNMRTYDDYTFNHSVNVCLLSIMVGLKIGLDRGKLFNLALGAVLHDLGKMLIPLNILNKPGELSPDEWKVMQAHTVNGYEILRRNQSIPRSSAQIAFQHHENYDGSGYPSGLAGDSIAQYAKIVSIVDAYDAIISDRPYRPALLPHEAYEVMLSSIGNKFDPYLAGAFLENIAIYPVGTTVRLDSGEIGVVLKAYPKMQARPVIKVIADELGHLLQCSGKIIDLSTEAAKSIVEVLGPEKIYDLPKMARSFSDKGEHASYDR